jgi:hypothetical protein
MKYKQKKKNRYKLQLFIMRFGRTLWPDPQTPSRLSTAAEARFGKFWYLFAKKLSIDYENTLFTTLKT